MTKTEIDELVRRYSRSPRTIDILRILLKSNGATPKQISEKIGASGATVSRQVGVSQQLKKLEKDGMVQWEYLKTDRRQKFYFLTEMSKKVANQLSKK